MDKEAPAVGIDVSKHKLDVALLVDGKVRSKSVKNSNAGYEELKIWITKQKVVLDECLVCMESTGVYSEPVALGLQALGLTVSIVNPARIKGFGQSELVRNKNDGIDAALIARYCAKMHPEPWQAAPPEQRRLRGLCDRLKALKDMRQQEENRLEAYGTASNTELEGHIQQHVSWLNSQIKQMEHDIDDQINRHPNLKRDADLMASIPGIGKATVAVMLGQVGDMHRFSSAKALAAHLGVSPRQRVSGTSVRGRTTMSRTGNRATRSALYMPAVVASHHNPVLRTFAERLRANGLPKKAVIGAVMRKLVHVMYAVVRSGVAFMPDYLEKRVRGQST
ncbi:IS110 family transposase [Rugamonas sp. FT107W]|uniref:IS110 family transposase n=1 Tax=Duganella vulcania TaxID=2692166 RepID=A0A845HFT7_9BURK|nr:IS110 family transposase [Duganella vulcania]MYN16389.1 IS110 family transposase [Duganella vulcania]